MPFAVGRPIVALHQSPQPASISMSIALPSLVSLVFVCSGAAIISYAIRMAAKATQSLSWPSTDGEIAHSAVLYQADTTATTNSAATYKADISYRYKVSGANYSSSRISLVDYASTSGHAQSIVGRYPDKSTVRVYYNPANHAEALLEPGSTGGINFLYLIGGGFAAVGLFFLIMSLTGHVHTHP
jgi:hypothetical protein